MLINIFNKKTNYLQEVFSSGSLLNYNIYLLLSLYTSLYLLLSLSTSLYLLLSLYTSLFLALSTCSLPL